MRSIHLLPSVSNRKHNIGGAFSNQQRHTLSGKTNLHACGLTLALPLTTRPLPALVLEQAPVAQKAVRTAVSAVRLTVTGQATCMSCRCKLLECDLGGQHGKTHAHTRRTSTRGARHATPRQQNCITMGPRHTTAQGPRQTQAAITTPGGKRSGCCALAFVFARLGLLALAILLALCRLFGFGHLALALALLMQPRLLHGLGLQVDLDGEKLVAK